MFVLEEYVYENGRALEPTSLGEGKTDMYMDNNSLNMSSIITSTKHAHLCSFSFHVLNQTDINACLEAYLNLT